MRRHSAAHVFRAFCDRDSGGVAILFGLSLIVIMGVIGLSLDYGRALADKTGLQSALDAAVLAGVSSSQDEDQQIAAAENNFAANLESMGVDGSVSSSFSHQSGRLVGTSQTTVGTTMLGILGISYIEVVTQSAASADAARGPVCFMAMHPTRKHTLELKGSVSVIAPDCHIYGNSDHPYDVVDPHTPQNYLIGKSVQAIGYGHHYLENVSPPLEYAPELIPDPLASMVLPTPGACDHDEKEVDGGSATLNPGVYCEGLEIKNGATVTLNPGLYIITEKDFVVEDSTLTGDGVTIMLADDGVEIEWQESEVRLSAPKSGTYASIVLMGARVNTKHDLDESTVDLHGIVYLPYGEFDWKNKGEPTIDAKWTVWIVDGVTWTGDGKIYINFKPEESDIPYVEALQLVIPRPGTPRLVN